MTCWLAVKRVLDTEWITKTVATIAPAGASSQGVSAAVRMDAAAWSIAPQLGAGGLNPSPANDNVASAMMNAGTSSVAWIPRNPRVAGRR